MQHIFSPTLDRILAAEPPALLFHYTSPAGLIGIVKEKQVWATNITYLNDTKEIDHAVDYAKHQLRNFLKEIPQWTEEEKNLLKALHDNAGNAAKRIYLFSLTEEGDLLSQWRAYCPPRGGYAIGVPSQQLRVMAKKQGFFLCPCVYDHYTQCAIIREIVDGFMTRYRMQRDAGADMDTARQQTAWEFGQHLALYGPVLKHSAFREEKEWRLISGMISEKHPQIDYRAGAAGIIPFFKFNLMDEKHPNLNNVDGGHTTVITGPCSDYFAAQMAVQFLCTTYLGEGTVGFGRSSAPYHRTW